MILDGSHLIFKYSAQKLQGLKGVLGDYWIPISKSLVASQKYIANINVNNKPLFNEASHMLSSSYLSKLSVYSNGLIQYQEPRLAMLTPTFGLNELYDSLFPEDHKEIEKFEKPKHRAYVDNHFVSRVTEKVHVKVEIDDRFIPNFYLNYTIDAIGRNGLLYVAKYIDFASEQKAAISHLLVTTDHLSRVFNQGKESNVSIFGIEPSPDSEEHKKWEFLHNRNGFKLYHPEQADEVAEMFLSSGAGKLLPV